MTCLHPLNAWKKRWSSLTDTPEKYYQNKKIKFKDPNDPKNYEKIKIACGHCLGCRLDHANTWATRIMIEAKRHDKNCFITLTYNPEHLPINKLGKMTLRKKDFQDFMKRLRYHIREKILYFGCGEYGTKTYRPHGHFIIFGWQPNDLVEIQHSKTDQKMFMSPTLSKIWGNGFVAIQELNYKTACYTARYVQKKAGIKPTKRKLSDEMPEPKLKIDERTKKPFVRWKYKYIIEKTDQWGREKEFLLMSKKPAIGLTYWNEKKNNIKENNGILLNIDGVVKKKPIPKYFKKKWLTEDMEPALMNNYKTQEAIKLQQKELMNKINVPDDLKEKKYLEMLKENLTFKSRFLKRGQN